MKNNEDLWKKYADASELAKVELELIKVHERKRWNKLVDEHHYLSSRLVGNQLRYVARIGDEWVALLSVGEASTHLADRDAHIQTSLPQSFGHSQCSRCNSFDDNWMKRWC